MERKIRVLVAKPGLDGHDRGAKLVAKTLRDAGMEVIYTGLQQTPEQIVAAALQEDVDVIGCSIYSAAHMGLMQKIVRGIKEAGLDEKLVILGGPIPKDDRDKLKAMGVAEVFPTRTPVERIVEFIEQHVPK